MNKEAKGMDYPGFIDYIQEHVREFICCNEDWDDIVDIRIVPVIRNNETVVNTMWILEDGRLRCPQINLDDFFRDYCMSLDMDGVMEGILDIYRRSRSDDSLLDPEDMEDFFKIRDRIVLRLVSGSRNRNTLKLCPHRKLFDMAITYRILAGKNSGGISTLLVTDRLMQLWGLDEAAVYALALTNTQRIFPPRLKDMETVMGELSGAFPEEEKDGFFPKQGFHRNMMILTNDCGINGASVICYPNLLKSCTRRLGPDFYILPSSIHEVILLPKTSAVLPGELVHTVHCANANVVSQEEILSDCVYYFSSKTGKIQKYTGQI